MKLLRSLFIISFFSLIITNSIVLSEKRDLSSPASRLVGHWKEISFGTHFYFDQITDKPSMTGSCIIVEAEIESYKRNREKYLDKVIELTNLPEKGVLELKRTFKESEKYAGMALYAKYKIISQQPSSTIIVIKIIVEKSQYLSPFFSGANGENELNLSIDKNGEEMKYETNIDKAILEKLDNKQKAYLELTKPKWEYIDSKISPESKK